MPNFAKTLVIAWLAIQAQPQQPLSVEARVDRLEKVATDSVNKANLFIETYKEERNNHRERIEELEHWKRVQEKASAEGDDPLAKAKEAAEKADAAGVKAKEAEDSSVDMLVRSLGGSAGVGAVVGSVLFYMLRRLRKELVENEALPGGKPAVAAPPFASFGGWK